MSEPKLLAPKIVGPEHGMRPNTPLNSWRINFIFNMGGLGDYVNYAAATHWLMLNCPWILGRVVTPRYLTPLMRDIHPKWECIAAEDFEKHLQSGEAIICPEAKLNGVTIARQFMTVVGAHPVDVGFAYYAGTTPPPTDGLLPALDYPKDRLKPEVKALTRYAVLPVGNVQASRKVTGKHLNPVIDYINSLGITPVFLGKRDMLGSGKPNTIFPEDINYSNGLDLRDLTTVKEAACIMQHAEFTLGLDTGLLHLAALMKDSRIIFAYNITSIAHREPRRNHGKHVNITLTESELQCIACQSKLKQVAKHTFDKCLYQDSKCIDLLFGNDGEKFKHAINHFKPLRELNYG